MTEVEQLMQNRQNIFNRYQSDLAVFKENRLRPLRELKEKTWRLESLQAANAKVNFFLENKRYVDVQKILGDPGFCFDSYREILGLIPEVVALAARKEALEKRLSTKLSIE